LATIAAHADVPMPEQVTMSGYQYDGLPSGGLAFRLSVGVESPHLVEAWARRLLADPPRPEHSVTTDGRVETVRISVASLDPDFAGWHQVDIYHTRKIPTVATGGEVL